MKAKNYLLYFNVFSLILLLAWLCNIMFKANNSMNIPLETSCPNKSYFNLKNHLVGSDISKLKENFPYTIYLDSSDLCSIYSIKKDISDLNALTNNNISEIQGILCNAYTNKLKDKLANSFVKYNPDSLIVMYRWAEKFNFYQDLDSNNARLFSAISSYWINFISNQLSTQSDANPKIKYEFKFRFLGSICQSKMYQPAVGNSHREKIILYIIDKDWPHLFERFWYGTSILFKIIVILFLLLTVYGYYAIIVLKLKKNEKK